MRHALQGLYNPTTFLHSTCFSTPNTDLSTSYDSFSSQYFHDMPDPWRRHPKGYADRKSRKPPIAVQMHHTPIPQLGPTAQERFLSALAIPSTESTTPSIASPLLLQPGQLPGSRVHSSQLASALSRELGPDVVTASDHFIERLFPAERLPFPVDRRVFRALAKAKYWDHSLNSFQQLEYTEEGMQKWLNKVGNIIGNAHNKTVMRSWWHGTCNLPPGGAPMNRKPDIVLISHDYYESLLNSPRRVNWLHIRSFAEVTTEARSPSRMVHTINAKSYLLFVVQFDRRFVPALSFNRSGEYTLTLTDREGQIRYHGVPLSTNGLESARLFLTMLAFFMFGDDTDIGLDPHFIRDPETEVLIAVNVDGRRYEIKDHIYTLESFLGRGTRVWIVARGGKQFVLKDSWVQADRVESEVAHLKSMSGHDEIETLVPTFIGGGDVIINGVRDSTANYRGFGLVGRLNNQRVHCRILTGTIGVPLTSFRSKKEFINGLLTVVSGESTESPL